MAMRSEAAVADGEFARALLELHRVWREIDLRGAALKVAEAQRLVAKAGADEVKLALHIERAASHLGLPGSLHGRVGEGAPVGPVRLWKMSFGELRIEADV